MAVLALLGRLDELATSEVQQAFTAVVEDGTTRLLLDLGGVEYISRTCFYE